MDIEKILKFAESYVRDYVFSIFSILTSPWGPLQEGSAETELDARKGRTWVFALLSISLGALAYTAGRSAAFKPPTLDSIGLVLTVWLWLLTAVLSHLLARLFGGVGSFVDTLGACLRILPTAYVLAGLTAMTVGLFSRAVTQDYAEYAALAFLLVQFVILIVYLPLGVARPHHLGLLGKVALTLLIPASVLVVNVVGIFVLMRPAAMMKAPPAEISLEAPTMSPAPK